jgi:hypothetical protein
MKLARCFTFYFVIILFWFYFFNRLGMNNCIQGIVLVSGRATLGPVGAMPSTSLLKKYY